MKVELSHDLIAKRVYETVSIEDKARAKAESMVKDRYLFSQTDNKFYLSEQELKFVNPYINEIDLNEQEQSFVETSRSKINSRARTAKFKNYLIVVLACVSVFGSVAVFEHFRANKASEIAEKATKNSQDLQDSLFLMHRNIQHIEEEQLMAATAGLDDLQLYSFDLEGVVRNQRNIPLVGITVYVGKNELKTDRKGRFDATLMVDQNLLGKPFYVQVHPRGYQSYTQELVFDKDKKLSKLEIILEKR